MKNIKINLLVGLTVLLTSFQSSCQNAPEKTEEKTIAVNNAAPVNSTDTIVQRPASLVNDFENILDNNTIDTLKFLVGNFEEKTAVTIAVVTIGNFSPHATIADYSVWLGNKWGIGLKEINNGIMVCVSATQQQCRISTGLGMEQLLSDAECQRIVNEKMLPWFQQGNFAMGISSGVKEIIRVLMLGAKPVEFETVPNKN